MSATLGRAPQPFPLDGEDPATDFEIWIEDFESYLSLQNITDAATQKSLLTNLAGLGIRKVIRGLSVPTPSGQESEYTVVRDALKQYFKPSVNPTVVRHKFRQRNQLLSESLTAYAAALRSAAEPCHFDDTTVDSVVNCQIRDQFIAGMTNFGYPSRVAEYT